MTARWGDVALSPFHVCFLFLEVTYYECAVRPVDSSEKCRAKIDERVFSVCACVYVEGGGGQLSLRLL